MIIAEEIKSYIKNFNRPSLKDEEALKFLREKPLYIPIS